VIEGKAAVLGVHKESTFLDIVCGRGAGRGNAYAVNDAGLLCCFSIASRVLEKWVNLKVARVYSISVTDRFICCSCADGIVRVFEVVTLEYVTTLPRPHPLGKELLTNESVTSLPAGAADEQYPDAVCCKLFPDSQRILCFYSDRSYFIWDIKSPKKIGKYRSFLAHASCVWDIDVSELFMVTLLTLRG
jgi:WD40 repeat protein